MTDRFLFRAKRIDNGEWVEGFYFCMVHDDGRHIHHFIMPLGTDLSLGTPIEKIQVEVDSYTICQCTGLKDKNGNLIWENDVVKGKYYDKGISHRHIGQVKYICEAYKAVGVKQYTGYHASLDGSYEVIGNIFDNPELMHE